MLPQKEEKTDKDVTELFHISGDKGYSEFWRKNKSPVEVIELANLLLATRKLASYIGRNVGQIV